MLEKKIEEYKKKYYTNKLIKGVLLSSAIILSYFLLINVSEFFSSFSSTSRAILFFSFVVITASCLVFWVVIPLLKLFNLSKTISNTDAAKDIGTYFPEVSDRLLNTLQLKELNKKNQSDLVLESIKQKEQSLTTVKFAEAVNYKKNKKYLKYVFPPFIITLVTLLFIPQLFTESTPRLINYTKDYKKEALFNFLIANESLSVFKGEDLTVKVVLEGIAIPNKVQLVTNTERKLKLTQTGQGEFEYTFKNVQRDLSFILESSGFQSDSYSVNVLTRPSLLNFSVFLEYPNYTEKKNNRLENTGNLIVPEGTKVSWNFLTQEAESLSVNFEKQSDVRKANNIASNTFEFSTVAEKSENYQINLQNQYAENKDAIEYFLNVIPDEFPSINVNQFADTVLYENLVIGGNIGDDYGITNLRVKYRVIPEDSKISKDKIPFKSVNIPFNQSLANQSFFYQLNVEELSLQNGDNLEYFIEVFDNDGVNGAKSSKSPTFQFKVPTKKELKKELEAESKGTENKIKDTFKDAEKLSKDIEDIQNKLKGKKKLSWQDKKSVENLIEDSKSLEKNIQQLQEQNELFNQKQQKLNFQDEEIAKKAEQLQKLMDELLDEETKKLYEELNKLMEQNFINKNLQDVLEDIELKQENIKSELDRALELFKKLKLDAKLNQIAKELEELAEEQDELAEETENAKEEESSKEGTENDKKEQSEQLKEEQKKLNEEFKDLKEDFKELDELNQDTQSPKNLEQLEQQQKDVEQEQKEAQQQLEQNNKEKASKSQKKSSQKMQQMAQQMQQMQQSGQMQQLNENYDDLRSILENLVTLSFSQEELMLQFRDIRRIDPKFVKLSQEQLKLKDDAKLIQDSLIALSKRVFQIESFVTREVNQMNKYMEESLEAIRKRTPELASSKQQFTMTSVNNLALLLNDILEQMQQQMSQSMSGQQNNEKQSSNPSMSELQQQLNQQLQNLKKSGKTGRALSEELAKLAAQQEMIRNAMKQLQKGNKPGGKDGKNGEGGENGYKEMLEKMEKTEEDLVNKRITRETIRRQKEILTRLLESEKAEKERELDNKREAEQAKQKNNALPQDFLDYLKLKETQVELLKTIPTSLNKYYKKQVNEYFKKLKD